MKKLLISLLFLGGTALFASEEAVKAVLKDLQKCQMEMNGTQMLALYHPAYTENDSEGKSISYAELKEETAELDAMRKVIEKATLPDADLLAIVTAVFVLNESELTPELRASISELQNSAEGKKLAAESAKTLEEIRRIYLESVEDVWKSCKILSVTVEKDSARINCRMKNSNIDRLADYTFDLIRVNDKWLIKKCVIK